MEIQIKSNENGWETDRKLVLPDDRKLTDAILRTVRRYQRNLEKAAAQETNTEEAAEETPADTQEDTLEAPAEEAPAPDVEKEPAFKGVSGFILAQCEECKDTWAFCSKYRIKFVTCKKCGQRTELRDIAPANLTCETCGKKWSYQTNCTDADLGCKCVECGHGMRAWWEPKKKAYIPQF